MVIDQVRGTRNIFFNIKYFSVDKGLAKNKQFIITDGCGKNSINNTNLPWRTSQGMVHSITAYPD